MDDESGARQLTELLDRAWREHGLKRVGTEVLQLPGEANRWTAVVQATVETERGTFAATGEATDGIAAAEDRALARALARATNTLAADPPAKARGTKRESPVETPAEAPVEVPEFLAAAPPAPAAPAPRETRAAAPRPEPSPAPAAPPQPAASPGPSRILATAQSLHKACANLGLAAPEPEADWGEPRLQEYVDSWSVELRRVRSGSAARRR